MESTQGGFVADAPSKPLSTDAREKLVATIESCIESLRGQSFKESLSAAAKEKFIDLLRTDIDIVMVLISVKTMYSAEGIHLITRSLDNKTSSRRIAEIIVRLIEQSRSIEIGARNS